MSIIKLSTFAGEAPSVSPRSMGESSAVTAKNLYAPTPEFRPLADDTTIGLTLAVSNPATLYKQQRTVTGAPVYSETAGWRATAAVLSYSKGQIDDDQTERTYYSYNDGVTAPRAFDVAGVDKPLGITPPSAAPVVTLNAAQKYTVPEDTAARIAIPDQLTTAVKSSATAAGMGNGQSVMTAGATDGWLLYTTSVSAGTNPAGSFGEYAYCSKMISGVNGYTVDPNFQWMTDASLHGKQVTYGGYVYWAVPMLLQGTGYTINTTTLTNALKEILNPDPDFVRTVTTGYTGSNPSKQIIDDAKCAAMAADVQSLYAATTEPQNTHIAAINAAQRSVVDAVQDYNKATPQVAAIKNFYATTNVTGDINNAIGVFADKVVLSTQNALQYDAGTWDSNAVGATLRSNIVGLFPSTFTVAGVGSNTLLNFFDADGSLRVKTDLVRASVSTLLSAEWSGAMFAQVNSPTTVLNTVLKDMDAALLSALATSTAASTLRAKYSDYPMLSDMGSRLAAVTTAIVNLRSAAKIVTEDYNAHTAELIQRIATLFDTDIAPYMPEPVTAVYDSRFYLTTKVSTWLEESAPSAPSLMLDKVDIESDTCTVGRPANYDTPSTELIAGWRLYRSNSGSDTTAFQLVVPPAGTTGAVFDGSGTFLYFNKTQATYVDDRKAAELGEVLPTTTWLPPPANLQGLTGMANGILVGFFDNTLCACEPYHPYAWPPEYQTPLKYPIVCIGSFGSSSVVTTRGNPFLLSGSDSASLTAPEMPSTQSCVSPRSMVSVDNGALYASPDGICFADASGVQVVTQGLFTREDWQKLTPSSIIAAQHDGVYYFLYSGNGGGAYGLDFTAKKLVSLDINGSALYVDKFTDKLYVSSGTTLKALFSGAGRRTAVYKTGVFTLPKQTPFAWLQVFSDFSSTVTVKWYGDGVLRHTHTPTSIEPLRLPAGRYLEHEIEITSAARITSVAMAGTTLELQAA